MAENQSRKLAAILAADIAGYSALMGADEARTVRDLKGHQAAVLPMVGAFGGRIIDTAGDGILAEFASIVNAVECAVAIQTTMAERNASVELAQRMQFRIGVNVGDVIYDETRIYGDGINIAARLEGIAEPGGVCVSRQAHDQVDGKIPVSFRNLGPQTLKNIAKPVEVFAVDGIESLISPSAEEPERSVEGYRFTQSTGVAVAGTIDSSPSLTLPDMPSIAVLPFQNMSGDPEQEYFADGMVEDIITALSRFHHLFVIARNSSFTYKGRAVDVKLVGRELGVRYVLEGSVRKAANRVRITGQLIDATNGKHLWADRFDGALEDVFSLQDQVTASVVGAIAPKLEQAEIERARLKPTESLDAYDLYLRGLMKMHRATKGSNNDALHLFLAAINLDPNFAPAHAMAAWCHAWRILNGWVSNREEEAAEILRLTREAAELGKDDATVFATSGIALAVAGHLDDAASFADRALMLNPNLAAAWLLSGRVKIYLGEPDIAIEHMNHAMRLSPLDPFSFTANSLIGLSHFLAGRYDEGSSWAEKALRQQPTWVPAARIATACHALAGRIEHAQRLVARMLELDPALRIAHMKEMIPLLRRPEDIGRFQEGLRKGGLPE